MVVGLDMIDDQMLQHGDLGGGQVQVAGDKSGFDFAQLLDEVVMFHLVFAEVGIGVEAHQQLFRHEVNIGVFYQLFKNCGAVALAIPLV